MIRNKTVSDLKKSISYDALDEKLLTLAEKGIIVLSGEIVDGAASIFFISTSFIQMARPGKPIWLLMKTPGGSATECFAICDIMRAVIKKGTDINILGVGEIASAGTALMQMGTRRCSFPLTQFLVHQASHYTEAGLEEVSHGEERVEELKRKNRIFLNLISERTGMGIEELIKLAKKTDYWLDAESAKSFGPRGLIDEVVQEYPFEF